jgi:hypothetical protein
MGDAPAGSEDQLRLANGNAEAVLSSVDLESRIAGSCFDWLAARYHDDPQYSDVRPIADADADVRGDWQASGVIALTRLGTPGGTPRPLINMAACWVSGDGATVIVLEQFVDPGNAQRHFPAAMLLQQGFMVN